MQSFSFYDYSIGNARQLGMKCIEKNYCCPLKMMEMKNEWGLLFEKRIRNACLSAIQTHNSGTLNF